MTEHRTGTSRWHHPAERAVGAHTKAGSGMKRAHDDISPPTHGDGPTKASAGVAAENGAVKGNEATSPAAGQSSAAPTAATAAATPSAQQRKKCPYLDTINRNVLDFDFEKVRNSCSLQLVRVYLCCSIRSLQQPQEKSGTSYLLSRRTCRSLVFARGGVLWRSSTVTGGTTPLSRSTAVKFSVDSGVVLCLRSARLCLHPLWLLFSLHTRTLPVAERRTGQNTGCLTYNSRSSGTRCKVSVGCFY